MNDQERIYKKYLGLEAAVKEGKVQSFIKNFSFDQVELIFSEVKDIDGLEYLKKELTLALNKINNFDEIKIRKDVEIFIKNNTFRIFRDYKFNNSFPEYTNIKQMFDQEYTDLLPKMPNEESRKRLEVVLAKKLLEKTDFLSYSDRLIEDKLANFKYYQIDVYEAMQPNGLFNSFFEYQI
tara:strand:- start:28250 stop:28789 length:540 start_codon:yes stop_codon:yes gene_type:complete